MVCIKKVKLCLTHLHIGVRSDHKTSCYGLPHASHDPPASVTVVTVMCVCACSATGKRLMTKCRMLLQENQELGKQLSQGKIAQLEAEIALQKKYSQELKASQDELSEYVFQVDEEAEGLQASVFSCSADMAIANKLTNKMTTRTNGPLEGGCH